MSSLTINLANALATDLARTYNPYQEFVANALQRDILRKLIPKDSFEADFCAEYTFHEANAKCAAYSTSFEWEIDRVVFGEVRRLLDSFFHPRGELLVQSYDDLFYEGRLGPGVNVCSSGTSLFGKLWSSPLSHSSAVLYEEYMLRVNALPNWREAEQVRRKNYGEPLVVPGSRTIFVPKTTATSRMICAEPVLNMFFQLGLASILERRCLSFFGIDMALQPKVNRRLAYEGSKDGSIATIDLSSASDSISLKLCKDLLPEWFYELLMDLRSPTTDIGGTQVRLHMMSTMGCGFTFPLQTILFAAISKACQNVFGRSGDSHVVAVFGDDIACPSWVSGYVIRYLKQYGFTPNVQKTFVDGPFRESCGADWLNGQPVRSVFIKKLDTPQDRVVAINALNDWSAYTGLSLRETIAVLYESLPRRFRNRIPRNGPQDGGIRVPIGLAPSNVDHNGSRRFISWEPRMVRIRWNESGEPFGAYQVIRKLKCNPYGLFLSAMYGEVKSMATSVRHNLSVYRAKRRVSPNWDWPADDTLNGYRLNGQQWETAVGENLNGLA